jgi:hypothetical protein
MGLAERRAVLRFAEEDYPAWKEQIEQAAGFDVPVEVEWDELAVPDYASSYAEFFPEVYFRPLTDALAAVTIDDLGKNAARDGLTKIVIRNSGDFTSTRGFTFADGVLTLDHRPDTNVADRAERTSGLRQLLESGL